MTATENVLKYSAPSLERLGSRILASQDSASPSFARGLTRGSRGLIAEGRAQSFWTVYSEGE